jgi:DNA-binding NtrC family response regulator
LGAQILIVDDCEDMRLLVRMKLEERFDAQYLEAESGRASATLLKSISISLVISDLEMPFGSGLWLHDFMLANQSTTPLILFTAQDFMTNKKPTEDIVLKAVVSKFDFDELIAKIEALNLIQKNPPPQ